MATYNENTGMWEADANLFEEPSLIQQKQAALANATTAKSQAIGAFQSTVFDPVQEQESATISAFAPLSRKQPVDEQAATQRRDILKQRLAEVQGVSVDQIRDEDVFVPGFSDTASTDFSGQPEPQPPVSTDPIQARIDELRAGGAGVVQDQEKGRIENLVDSVQFGLGRTGANLADAAMDAASRVLQDGFGVAPEDVAKHSVLFDSFDEAGNFTGLDEAKLAETYGYDQKRTKEALQDLKKAYKTDSTFEMVKSLGNAIVTAGPEFIGESMGELVGGLPKKAITSIMALAPGYANNMMEERIANQGGEPLTYQERMGLIGLSVPIAAVNRLAVGEMFGKTNAIGGVVDQVIATSQIGSRSLFEIIGKKALTLTGKAGYEGAEEVVQEFLQKFGERYGNEAQKDLFGGSIGEELFQAFGGGVAGGAAISGPTQAGKALGEASRELARRESNQEIAATRANLSPEDSALQELSFETDVAAQEANITVLDESIAAVESAESGADLNIPGIRERVLESVNTKTEQQVKSSPELVAELQTPEGRAQLADLHPSLSEESTVEEIQSALQSNEVSVEALLNTETAKNIQRELFGDLDTIKSELTGQLQEEKAAATAAKLLAEHNQEQFLKGTKPTEKKAEAVDPESKAQKKNIEQGVLASLFSRNTNREAYTELDTYTAGALKLAVDNKTTPEKVKLLAKRVLAARTKAKSKSQFKEGALESMFTKKPVLFKSLREAEGLVKLGALKDILKGSSTIETTTAKAEILKHVDDMANDNTITQHQADVLKNRINKMAKGAKEPTKAAEEPVAEPVTEEVVVPEQAVQEAPAPISEDDATQTINENGSNQDTGSIMQNTKSNPLSETERAELEKIIEKC